MGRCSTSNRWTTCSPTCIPCKARLESQLECPGRARVPLDADGCRTSSLSPERYNSGVNTAAAPDLDQETPSGRSFTLRQRLSLWCISWAGFLAIRLIGPTLRFAVSFEDGAPNNLESRPVIFPFWHRCVFAATYLWRDLQIRVITSRSFDGEYIARIIRKFGFGAIRGSSSRGGANALLEARADVVSGWSIAFTIDGPRGPRYVAKPGPLLLAKATGAPIAPFYIAVERAWILNTWDRFMIPKPFSRALMRVAQNIAVTTDADEIQMKKLQHEMQVALERAREFAEANVRRAGDEAFPLYRRKVFVQRP